MDRDGIHLSRMRDGRQIAMNDRFDLVPLDKDADFLGGRAFSHDGSERVDSLTLAKLKRMGIGNATKFWIAGHGEDMDKLTNDVFDGRISQEYAGVLAIKQRA